MKILIVSNMFPDEKHPSSGTFVKNFCDEIANIGINYDLAVMVKADTGFQKLKGYLKFYIGTFFKLIRKRYDIVYIHYASHSSIPVLLASKFVRLKIYTNVHGSDVVPENSKQEPFQKYTRKILKLSEKIIVPSEYFKDYVLNKYHVDNGKIYVYPSAGIDFNIFYKLAENEVQQLKKQYNLPGDLVTFCFVGRITTNKGWDSYLQAISLLVKWGVNANYIVVGDGNEQNQYDEMADRLGLSSYIKKYNLLPQKSLADIYNASDALVFSSRRAGESLGLVAIEAMACGTPVISCDFAAPKYYVENGYNGYKIPVNDADSLAHIMLDFISGEKKKADLTEGCLVTAKKFENHSIRDELKNIFDI